MGQRTEFIILCFITTIPEGNPLNFHRRKSAEDEITSATVILTACSAVG